MLADSISYNAAFLAGLLSFFSPCILPLVPAYFTFITGYSLDELTNNASSRVRIRVVLSTLAFISGFSVVFVLLGVSASFAGSLIAQYQDTLRIIGGAIIIILGIHISGIYRIKFLDFEKRLHLTRKPMHFLGTFVVGMAFGAGWSPCIGPLLGSIMAIAASSENITQGVYLLTIYSAGLALPFLGISVFIHLILQFVRKGTRVVRYVNAVAGCMLIVVGILLIADKLKIMV